MDCVSIALVAVGGALELAGVAAVVFEIRRDVRQARGLLAERREPAEAEWESYTEGVRPRLSSRREPATFHDLEQLGQDLYDAIGEAERRMDERDDKLHRELSDEMFERDDAIRSALRDALAPDARWRYAGVAALALGIVLTTVGGALGATN